MLNNEPTPNSIRNDLTVEEVSRHNIPEDAWVILDDKVYNISPYLEFHPGGVETLMLGIGGDCSSMFYETHKVRSV